ncbi:MAG: redoxin domain-containing protein [Candidatus Buchananbacteria bacterium]|nr:redoxin domain-containing protein [Candidatus Buchananbacteria bacterium]
MLVYAHNPFGQLVSVFKSAGVSMEEKQAPEFVGISDWINTPDGQPIVLGDLVGEKVILVDFWTYSCINCQRSVPFIEGWYQKYQDQGLLVVGIHTPEFRFEENLDNVKKAVGDYGLTYPVGLDNGYKTWRAYNNLYWPALYLIDQNGQIVYMHFGEGMYEQTEQKIEELLADLP